MTATAPGTVFPAVTRDDWLRLVTATAGGVSGIEALSHRTYDGLAIEPIYARPAKAAPDMDLARAAPGRWDVRPLHDGADAGNVHNAIAEDIAGGATSISLQLATPGQLGLPPRYDAIATALEGFPFATAKICFSAGDQYFGAAQALLTLADETGLPPTSLRGAVHADPLGALARTGALEADLWSTLEILGRFVTANLEPWPNVRLLIADGGLYHDAGASEAQELAAMLATVVEYLRVMDFESVAASRVLPHLTIGLAADCDLFATLAKVRAARLLMARLCEACGASETASSVELWVTTSRRMLTRRAAHTNILRNTIAATAAALGGADSITVLPHTWAIGAPTADARRLARNVHALLLEESGIAQVLDPAAGSGAVTALTDAMAGRAWALFQDIETKGGMARALQAGIVQAGIAETVRQRGRDIAGGKLAIIGVTAFASESEPTDKTPPHGPAAGIEIAKTRAPALPVLRLSEPYEAN